MLRCSNRIVYDAPMNAGIADVASVVYSQPDAFARDGQQRPSLTRRVMKCSLLWNRYAKGQSQKSFATKRLSGTRLFGRIPK